MNEQDTLYARWLEGNISPEELQALQQSGELEELEAIIQQTEKLTMPAYNIEEGYQRFKNKNQKKETPIRTLSISKWVIGIAASLALLVAAWFLVFNTSQTELIALNGDTKNFTFVDGSTVALNDGSSIYFDEKNWTQNRSLQLKGEALFQVQKGASFIVNTPNGTVEVLGTQFNVRAWGENLHVECYTGKVQVRSQGQEQILTKNQSVHVVNQKMQDIESIQHEKPLWSTGNSRFYEEDIHEVFAELERQYNVNVTASIKNRTFSGNFNHDDLTAALTNICKPLGIKFTISADQKTVLIEEK